MSIYNFGFNAILVEKVHEHKLSILDLVEVEMQNEFFCKLIQDRA